MELIFSSLHGPSACSGVIKPKMKCNHVYTYSRFRRYLVHRLSIVASIMLLQKSNNYQFKVNKPMAFTKGVVIFKFY